MRTAFIFLWMVIAQYCVGDPPVYYNVDPSNGTYNGAVFLVSFDHSGNSWTRYCLEYLTKRPSFRMWDDEIAKNYFPIKYASTHLRHAIGVKVDLGVDFTKPIIIKCHRLKNKYPNVNPRDSIGTKLILLIRNPKECFLRYFGYDLTVSNLLTKADYFFTNLEIFDSWREEDRFLMYYEDLIQNPRATLTALLNFLGENDRYLDGFMQDYEYHRQTSLSLYTASVSKGNDMFFHSKKKPLAFREKMDLAIKKEYPELWEKYLKRYEERI